MERQIYQASEQLSAINSHHETPFYVLGMDSRTAYSTNFALNAVQDRVVAEFFDGSVLYRLNMPVYSLMREGLSLGSYIETGILSSQSLPHDKAQRLLQYTTVGIVLSFNEQRIRILGVKRRPRPEEVRRGMQQGVWGEYTINGTVYREKDDAYTNLARIFSSTRGSEGTQMISSVLKPSVLAKTDERTPISNAGCASHNMPLVVLPDNIHLTGIYETSLIDISPTDDSRVVLVALDTQRDGFRSLNLNNDPSGIDEERTYHMGLIYRSQQMGEASGISPDRMLDAIHKTIYHLPEMVGNGANISHASGVLRTNIGLA